ncbi:benzoate/H(+) symporter BenE family transporter, partial [Microbacterium indicum]|uniref:benzoate/H(+) symporter BenE family transporter n=1 Tax=Microbacterium indicum TaxID=358100 RepID=UPI00056B7FDE
MRALTLAGITATLTGFTSSAAVVLAGLRAMGATPTQAASGLVAACVLQAIAMLWATRRTRIPLMIVWSTPGMALLASASAPQGGFPAAVGAFLVTGALIVLTGFWPLLARLVTSIPTPIAQAMLAGVLVQLCLKPVAGAIADPAVILPLVVVWLALMRFAPTWASTAAFAAGLVALGVEAIAGDGVDGRILPALEFVAPTLDGGAIVGIALPLYVVTMASQNLPGTAILASYGYRAPWRFTMGLTGVGSMVSALFGGGTLNMGALTTAMVASPDAHPDPAERWKGVRVMGIGYGVMAVFATALMALSDVDPAVLAAVAGLALIPTLASSLTAAVSDTAHRLPAVVTFLVGASGVTILGIGAAFWALLVGLVAYAVLRPRAPAAGR